MRTKAMSKFISETISVEHDECVIWPFSKDKDGYGRLRMNGERRAHRGIYKAAKGEIPNGCELMHVCDTPSCVNPHHLRPGTHKQNMLDMRAKGRAASIQIDNRGEAHPKTLLKNDDIRAIRADYARNRTNQGVLAERYRISRQAVSDIVRRVTWKHV